MIQALNIIKVTALQNNLEKTTLRTLLVSQEFLLKILFGSALNFPHRIFNIITLCCPHLLFIVLLPFCTHFVHIEEKFIHTKEHHQEA